MAMLAEPRSKQKWSEDPRNTNWSKDKERYGYQMLEKMGWETGNGLGRKQNGETSHVKIKKRKNNLGLGAKESHDQDWIAHQEDFNNLLSALNQHGGNAELRSEEQNNKAMLDVAKASRKRVFYKKFIRSKDTSGYSDKDMACIFGSTATQSAPATPQNQSDAEQSDDSAASCPPVPTEVCNDTGVVTYTSKDNIHEYFARKMKEIKGGKVSRTDENEKLDSIEKNAGAIDQGKKSGKKENKGDNCAAKKDKKRKAKFERTVKISGEDAENGTAEVNDMKRSKNKKKGGQKVEKCEEMDDSVEVDVPRKKAKRREKRKFGEVTEMVDETCSDEISSQQNERKNKRKDGNESEPMEFEKTEEMGKKVRGSNSKKKKRKKIVNENEDCSEQMECGKMGELGETVKCGKMEDSKKKKKKRVKVNKEIDNELGLTKDVDIDSNDQNEDGSILEVNVMKVKRKKGKKKKSGK